MRTPSGTTGMTYTVTGAGTYAVAVTTGSCTATAQFVVNDRCDVLVDKRILAKGEYV
jgi:Flp pilus assembly protein CpaB